MSRLVPKLFYPVDQPHQESISSLAKVHVSRYLDPVMRDLQPYTPAITATMESLPVFQSRSSEGGCAFSESALSRMVSVLFDVMSNTMSRYSTVSQILISFYFLFWYLNDKF